MKSLDLTKLGGFPLNQENLDWLQQGYNEQIKALIEAAGTQPAILAGCVDDGTNISSGWIYYNGEIMPLTGGATDTLVHIETITSNLLYENGTYKPSKIMKQAVLGAGSPQFNFSDLKPYPVRLFQSLTTDWVTVSDSNANYSFTIKYRRNLIENTVELIGEVNINDGTWYVTSANPNERESVLLTILPTGYTPLSNQYFTATVIPQAPDATIRTAYFTIPPGGTGATATPFVLCPCFVNVGGGVYFRSIPTVSSAPYKLIINTIIKLY